jgi:hypothetical protein
MVDFDLLIESICRPVGCSLTVISMVWNWYCYEGSLSPVHQGRRIHLPSICLPGECTNTLIGNANVNVKKQFRDDSFNLLIVIYIFLVVALTPEHKGHKGFNCLQFAYLVNAPTH